MQLYIRIAQNERQPLAQTLAFTGVGTIYDRPGFHEYTVVKRAEVYSFMEAIEPWLSERRKAQWEKAQVLFESRIFKGNWQANKTHCPHGHPYDSANTYYHKSGRHCRMCRAERARVSAAVTSLKAQKRAPK